MKTLLYESVGDVLVLVHGEVTPSDDEWGAYVRELGARYQRLRGILVVTDSAGPNVAQRTNLNELVAEHGSKPTAVLSHSTVVRGIVTALSWFHSQIRSFTPTQLAAALEFLRADPSRQEATLRTIMALRIRLATNAAGAGGEGSKRDMDATLERLDQLMTRRLPALRAELARRNV